ncbi:hypothetical protein ACFQ10_53350 [Streptomyces indonesiensis]
MAALAADLGQEAFTSLTWRQGSRGELRSRVAAVRVRPAGNAAERPIRAAASAEQGWWDGILPDYWLLVEWPEEAEAPTDYWLSNLPADTPIADLVRLAKVSAGASSTTTANSNTPWAWTTSKAAPGPAQHHHVTLVTATHAFLTEQRLAPKVPGPSSLSTRPSTPSKTP